MEKKVNGLALYEYGPAGGLPIVLIHGFPLSHAMWEPQLSALSNVYRVIAYDVRGHGQSEVGDGQYTLELFVDDLMAILDCLKITQAVLCGLSMGGYIVLRAAERHPGRWLGLILCDTKTEADSNQAKIKRAAAIHTIKKDGAGFFAQAFVKSVLNEDTLIRKPEIVQWLRNLIRLNSPVGICGALLAMAARTDTTAVLPKLTMPVLVLVGEQDKLTPPSASEVMAKALPKSIMHIIPGAAHMSNLENPEVFNEKVLAFLKQF